jgi:hypothetical protein
VLGLAFFTLYGAIVALSELALFVPCFVFALRTSYFRLRTSVLLAVIWLALVWLIASSDPVREATIAALLHDRTKFAPGFSETKFAAIAEGHSQAYVRDVLGDPLEEGWIYVPEGMDPLNTSVKGGGCRAVRFKDRLVSETFTPAACEAQGIRLGASKPEVQRLLGVPSDSCWDYGAGPPRRPFRFRLVCFHGPKSRWLPIAGSSDSAAPPAAAFLRVQQSSVFRARHDRPERPNKSRRKLPDF